MTTSNTVRLAIYGQPGVEVEHIATATIRPGEFLKVDTFDKVAGAPTADPLVDGPLSKLIAVKSSVTGKGISGSWVDTISYYETGDRVSCYQLRPGDKVWAWLAPGETTAIGTAVFNSGSEVAGAWNGCLQVFAGGVTNIEYFVGNAAEAVAAVGSPARVAVIIA